MSKKTVNQKVDLNKLSIAIRLSPVAKYEDGTWGAKIESIVLNNLPNPALFNFPAITRQNKQIFLLIENGKATLEQPK